MPKMSIVGNVSGILSILLLASMFTGAFIPQSAKAATSSLAGNYIVAEYSTEKLSMVTPGGVRTEIYSFKMGTYDDYPGAVAIDGSGNYIVTAVDEGYYGELYRITSSGSETLVYAWAKNEGPSGVAVDGSGNYIVAEPGLMVQALSKITPSGVRTVIYDYTGIHGFLIYPQTVAIDSSGNYIVTESHAGEANTLSKITPGGVRTVLYTFAAGQWPSFVAIDGSGNYIVTDYVTDTLSKITSGGVRTVIYDFGGGAQVMGVAVDGSGNYIVAEQYANKLSKITPGGVRTVIYTFILWSDPAGVAIVPGAAGYSATIWGWDYIYGWQIPVPITMDGVATGYSTPHTFTGLTGTHTFTVPSTNSAGHVFGDWDTGSTDRTITVSSAGTYTARYRGGYSATIWAWNVLGWISEPITMNGVSTGFSTPYTFTGLSGTHTFTVPSTDAFGYQFSSWDTGETNPTLTVSSGGTHTAQYGLNFAGFADGFESGSFSAWSGTSATTGENKLITSSLEHHGTYSADFTSNGNGGTERAYCYKTITSQAELYARGYFRVVTSGIADNDDRFYFVIFKVGSTSVAFAGWKQVGGIVKWNLLIRSGTGWANAYSTTSPSLNQWYSVELHWKKDAAAGIGELWVDGIKVCSVTGKNTAYYGNVNRVEFGLPEIVQCGSTNVYGDCVKLSSAYIGPEPTTLLTDGYESGSFSAWTGTSFTSGETASVVNTIAHHGTYSAKFTSNGNLGTERAYSYKTVTSSSELFARGYFRITTSGISANDNRFYFVIFKAGSTPVAFAGWRMTGGVLKWNLLIRSGTGWATAYSAASPTLNQWYCVELHWKKDATAGLGQLYVNGALVCSITGKNTTAYGNANRVEFGLPEIVNCASTTTYCDCAEVATTYIGPES